MIIMKLPALLPRKKLRATTARRSLGLPDDMDYEQMSEPNMKLSRALLIVLVLHVVAVAGIIAFNTIKTRQGPVPSVGPAAAVTAAKTGSAPAPTLPAAPSKHEDAKPAHLAAKPAIKEEHKIERAKPAESAAPKETGKTYVVARGDNPVTIARKFKIPYDDLIAANHIDDPHKLKIGQKLIIPTKPARSKKSGD